MKLRLLLAIAAMLAVQLLMQQAWQAWFGGAGPRTEPGQFAFGLVFGSGLSSLLGAGVGAAIAGRRFLLPALTIWALAWLVMVYALLRIAGGQGSALDVLQSNWPGLLATLLATVFGSLIGGAMQRPPTTGRPASAA